MIAGINGILELVGSDYAIINVNGIGFHVYVPTSTLGTLGNIGKPVKLYTHLHFREDSITLYGFAVPEELQLFQTLLVVAGVGPKLALAVLSAITVEQAVMAIVSGSINILTVVPGMGKKTASRIILELKDKIAAGFVAPPAAQLSQENADMLAALISLGYSVSEATRAITSLPPSSDLNLEDKIKLALGYFAQK
ncbi:Holliday junction branch migration protein RuvA [Chloroflexota bacterium]